MEDWRQDIGRYLKERLKGRLILGEPMAPHTTFRIGGPADAFVEAECVQDLKLVADFLAKHPKLNWQILGGGSNVVYPERFPGLVIHPGPGLSRVEKKDNTLIAGAGAKLMDVITSAAKQGLGGMDFLAGIPGSIGGAVKGNAGAFGQWIEECVEKIAGFDLVQKSQKEIAHDDIDWSYRKTDLEPSLFICQVYLKLQPCTVMDCMDRISRALAKRSAKHPGEPSAGCVFVNPEPPRVTAGKLIDQLGFKGRRIGDAMCSPKHANFIVNLGNATQSDVVRLINEIKQAVKKRFGYELAEEIRIVKENMEENNG